MSILNNALTLSPYPMLARRILSSLVTATMCFSLMQPAMAARSSSTATSTDEVLATLKAFDPNTICTDRTGKDLGRCIGDVLKRIASLRNDFVQAERKERQAWMDAHGTLGIGTEYRTALQAYSDSVKAKRAEFTKIQRELEKIFFDQRKAILNSVSSGTGSFTRVIKADDMQNATAKCAKQSDASGLRICLRQQLRLLNPKTKLLNISPEGVRMGQ